MLWLLHRDLVLLFKMELIFGFAFSITVGYLKDIVFKLYFYHIETGSASLMHAYSQLQKLVFPHQLELMKVGFSLEESMPIGSGEAVVICYDIQNSSHLPEDQLNQFVQKILEQCHHVFAKGYCQNPLQITAFKLKEMGDGFICTIGFPFQQPGNLSIYETGINVAFECQRITAKVRAEMGLSQGYCSIGIASGTLYSFFTRVGIKVYDIYGIPLVKARRYEEFRKHCQHLDFCGTGDIVSVQAQTLDACPQGIKNRFRRIDLETYNLNIRDDVNAKHLYMALIEGEILPGLTAKAS